MSKNKQVQKRHAQSLKNRSANRSRMSMMRTLAKKTMEAVNSRSEDAGLLYRKLQQQLDRNARKGLIHINKANRQKSNIVAKIKSLNSN